jgi:hypothetical protein
MMSDIPKLNKIWHETHKMPKNATIEERIEWHQEHMLNCLCRPPPQNIASMIAKKKN